MGRIPVAGLIAGVYVVRPVAAGWSAPRKRESCGAQREDEASPISYRHADPTADILDSRTLQSTPTSGSRAGFHPTEVGWDGTRRRKGSKVHAAVDTLGNSLAIVVTPANEQDRAQAGVLCEAVQRVCDARVEIAFVDQGYTGESAREAAAEHAIRLAVVKHSEAKHGFVLLPRRWAVERSFGWLARFRRLARDYERWPETLAGLHFLAFVALMLRQLANQGVLSS